MFVGLQKYLQMFHLLGTKKRKFTMLENVSGIIPAGAVLDATAAAVGMALLQTARCMLAPCAGMMHEFCCLAGCGTQGSHRAHVSQCAAAAAEKLLSAGRMTLLLGPPGAGKSTLLKALSGKLIGSDLKVSCH